MRCFGSLSVLTVCCLACYSAHADESLPPVEVTADCIGGTAVLPVSLMGAFHLGQPPNHQEEGHFDDFTLDLTKDQVCQILHDNKPPNCSTSVYPPAPGIKSSSGANWSGNGCGAGSTDPLTTMLTSYLLRVFNSNYSGNLNAPIIGRPDIDFTDTCNRHDGWYTSSLTKARADHRFAAALTTQCGGVGDSAGQGACNTASSEYQLAVDKKGQSSYEEDQAQYKCAAWADSMKKDGCGN